jgi:hypothetical protein
MMADKCEHCRTEAKDHSYLWLTTSPGYPGRPVEDGPEWGTYRLWVGLAHERLAGIVCNKCWSAGKRFKEGFDGYPDPKS